MHSIAMLKQLLIKSDKLDKVWDYFFELMDKGILLKDGHIIEDPENDNTLIGVLAAIRESTRWQLGQSVTVTGSLFSETPSEYFYQGTCSIQNIFPPAVAFYFSDVEMGSFAYSKNGQNEMFRFSLTNVTDLKTRTKH